MQKLQSQIDLELRMLEMEFTQEDLTVWTDELWQVGTFGLEPEEAYFMRAWRLELDVYERLLFGRYDTDEKFQKDLERDPAQGYSTRMLDFVEEIALDKAARNPNSWTHQDVHGEIQTFIVCKDCRWINNMSKHRVEESGRVNPCVVCEGCKVHDFVWLKDWKFGLRAEIGDGRSWSAWWGEEDTKEKPKKQPRKQSAKVATVAPVQGMSQKDEPLSPRVKVWDWVKKQFV